MTVLRLRRAARLSDPLRLPAPVARLVGDPERVRACGHDLHHDSPAYVCAEHVRGGLRCWRCHERHVRLRHGAPAVDVPARAGRQWLSHVPTVTALGVPGPAVSCELVVVGGHG